MLVAGSGARVADVVRLAGGRVGGDERPDPAILAWVRWLAAEGAFPVTLAAGVCLRVDWWQELPQVGELEFADLCEDDGRLKARVATWLTRELAKLATLADDVTPTGRAGTRRTQG